MGEKGGYKLSEIARYYAARELTASSLSSDKKFITLDAPFAAPDFALRVKGAKPPKNMTRAFAPSELKTNTWHREGETLTLCFDLKKGRTVLEF